MFAVFPTFAGAPLAAGAIPPVLVLAMCVVAGVGTVLVLPGSHERSVRTIGGGALLCVFLIFAALLIRQGAMKGAGQVYFWLFAAIAILSAVRVISHDKPVYSALYFLLTVVATAGLFVLLWAEFMAAALVLIYAGAIVATYVFVIMLAQQTGSVGRATEGGDYDRISREPIAACAVGFTLMGLILFVIFDMVSFVGPTKLPKGGEAQGTAQRLGEHLFTSQVVSLEMAAVILAMAVVGAVVIAGRKVAEPAPAREPTGDVHDVDPKQVPVYGTDERRTKVYPEK